MTTNDKVSEALETLTAEIEKLQTESGLVDYLAWQARFWTYSPANALLIRVQRPDATQVAGFQRWIELGRCVRKGEHGILILAPVFRRREDEEEGEKDRRPVSYRAAYVFDTAQTAPLPGHENDVPVRPEIACPVLKGNDGAELCDVLMAVAKSEGLTVSHEPPAEHAGLAQNPDCQGFYVPNLSRIWIRPNAPLQETKTLAHEIAHYVGAHDESNPANEAIAEAVAFVVLQAFGLDSSERSVPYVTLWDSRQPGVFRGSLNSIQTTARTIIQRAMQHVAGKPAAEALAA